MPLNQIYRKDPPYIISYNYIDIASRTGVIVFYGSDTDDNGTVTYQLATNAIYSANVLTQIQGVSGVEMIGDLDFDIIFNFPKRIKGKVIANIPVIMGNENTANKGGSGYAVLKVRHVTSGGSESEIASNTKSAVISVGSLDTVQAVLNVEVDVATIKQFKKGETLRLTVEVWAATQQANGLQAALMHDPKNRVPTTYSGGIDAGEFITSTLSFNVPFVLNV